MNTLKKQCFLEFCIKATLRETRAVLTNHNLISVMHPLICTHIKGFFI